tara:strand:- start:1541 stop:3364 length:1824 start_codon:yes stop_codon:yes gene_type:complete
MDCKNSENNASFHPPKIVDEYDMYNSQVVNNIQKNELSEIQKATIKIFKDKLHLEQKTPEEFNKKVVEFNNLHGPLIKKIRIKKGTPGVLTNYSYINYPYLDTSAVKETMRSYRSYVYQYNKMVLKQNKEISKYNLNIANPTNAKEKKLVLKFKQDYNSSFTSNYNDKVEEYNTKHGNFFKKRKINTIKYQTEIIFHTLVGFYVKQLKIKNLIALQSNKSTRVEKNKLPKLDLDHRKIATHNIDDIPRLSISKKTVQNHVKRLREAGVLINYRYINQNKPISINFNPKILVILEGKQPKRQNSKNQSLNPLIGKNLHDNNETISAKLNKKKIKDNPKGIVDIRKELTLSFNSLSAKAYKNTEGITNKKSRTSGSDFVGKYGQKSNKLREKILDDYDFANKLASKEFENYKPIEYYILKQEELYGTLTVLEFRKLLLQDFIKSSYKLWKTREVYFGVWLKAIRYVQNNYFKSEIKEILCQSVPQHRWRLEFARKWFLKKKFNSLFPYQYFDLTRTQTNEVGYVGSYKVWKTYQRINKDTLLEAKNLQQAAAHRKEMLSQRTRLKKWITKYEKGSISYDELFTYATTSLHHSLVLQIPLLLTPKNNCLA